MDIKDKITIMQEKLEKLTKKHEKELKENKNIFFSQYTKGQIDAFEEILSILTN